MGFHKYASLSICKSALKQYEYIVFFFIFKLYIKLLLGHLSNLSFSPMLL